ncbi:MAG TPA: hypothetical protein DEA08_12710 [Planctomycetes bacterium]|nr:hypothetical protein [Planctomycetota bacterium]
MEGYYRLRGRLASGETYRGAARIVAGERGPELIVQREGRREAFRAPLRKARAGFLFRAEGSAGLADRVGVAAEEQIRLEARIRRRGERLLSRWRLTAGERVLARGSEELRKPATSPGQVYLSLSVDWEGRDLTDENLGAMERFRERFPTLPLTHFLNAAYYTKPGARGVDVTRQILRALRPDDERGLHLHGWRSLFEAAGVAYRAGPTFWGAGRPPTPCAGDEGHEVEVSAYTCAELRRVVAYSKSRLAEAGLKVGGSFRAGGWVAPRNVIEAVRAEGLAVDASAVPARWHDELRGTALLGRLEQLWATIQPTTQPYFEATPQGQVLRMIDTGALADYVSADEMVAHVERALQRRATNPSRDIYVHLGFHQETAARYLPRLQRALERLLAKSDPHLVIETLAGSARRLVGEAKVALARAPRKHREEDGIPLPAWDREE